MYGLLLITHPNSSLINSFLLILYSYFYNNCFITYSYSTNNNFNYSFCLNKSFKGK